MLSKRNSKINTKKEKDEKVEKILASMEVESESVRFKPQKLNYKLDKLHKYIIKKINNIKDNIDFSDFKSISKYFSDIMELSNQVNKYRDVEDYFLNNIMSFIISSSILQLSPDSPMSIHTNSDDKFISDNSDIEKIIKGTKVEYKYMYGVNNKEPLYKFDINIDIPIMSLCPSELLEDFTKIVNSDWEKFYNKFKSHCESVTKYVNRTSGVIYLSNEMQRKPLKNPGKVSDIKFNLSSIKPTVNDLTIIREVEQIAF